jgi:hypothetical protein
VVFAVQFPLAQIHIEAPIHATPRRYCEAHHRELLLLCTFLEDAVPMIRHSSLSRVTPTNPVHSVHLLAPEATSVPLFGQVERPNEHY